MEVAKFPTKEGKIQHFPDSQTFPDVYGMQSPARGRTQEEGKHKEEITGKEQIYLHLQ